MEESAFKNLLKGEKIIWIIYILFCVVSLIEVFSADSRLTFKSGDIWAPITKHATLLLGSIITAWFVHRIPFNSFKLLGVFGYFGSLFFLLITILFGHATNDTTRWISVMGFQFQPSELAKVCLILVIARIISKGRDTDGTLQTKATFMALGAALLVIVFIVFDNFSTAALIGFTVLCLMFMAKMKRVFNKWLAIIIVSFGLLTFGAFVVVPPQIFKIMATSVPFARRAVTWQHRILNWDEKKVAPEDYDLDNDAQVAHANIAIVESNGIGKLPGNSTERDYLSQASSDFIFAIIIEETGLLGAACVIFLYIALIVKIGQIAAKCKEVFPIFTLMGIAIIVTLQALTNMAVAVSIIPVTGQPLPFISRGGSSLIVSGIYIGLILGISRYADQKDEIANEVEDEHKVAEAGESVDEQDVE